MPNDSGLSVKYRLTISDPVALFSRPPALPVPAVRGDDPPGPGRPPIPVDLSRIRELAALGLSAQQIADRLGISRRTLFNRMESDPEIRAAMDAGLSEATEFCARTLLQMAEEKNLGALIFFLKTRGGFTVPKEAPQPPTVVVNVGSQPAPVTLEHAECLATRQATLLRRGWEGDAQSRISQGRLMDSDEPE